MKATVMMMAALAIARDKAEQDILNTFSVAVNRGQTFSTKSETTDACNLCNMQGFVQSLVNWCQSSALVRRGWRQRCMRWRKKPSLRRPPATVLVTSHHVTSHRATSTSTTHWQHLRISCTCGDVFWPLDLRASAWTCRWPLPWRASVGHWREVAQRARANATDPMWHWRAWLSPWRPWTCASKDWQQSLGKACPPARDSSGHTFLVQGPCCEQTRCGPT